MAYKKNILIEGEKEQILSLYGTNNNSLSQYVILDWVSPDDKYVIFLDELIDVENKKLIGNIWENFDNFKLFLRQSFETSKDIPSLVKESILDDLNKLVITESTGDYSVLKPYVKQFILEQGIMSKIKGGLQDFSDWGKKNIDSAITGVQDFAKTVGSGAVDFVKKISNGDFKKALEIIGKGIIYLMRSVRNFMYHPVGMVIDAVFVTLAPATVGVTEVLKWLPWAVIVALDILEITNLVQPEEELPSWVRYLLLGVDVLGLVTTAPMAAPIRNFIKGLVGKSAAEVSKLLSTNPTMKTTLQKMVSSFKKVPSFFEKASSYLKNSKLGSLFGQAMSNLGGVIKNATSEISKLLGTTVGKGTTVAATTTGIIYGVEKAGKAIFGGESSEYSPEEISSMTSGTADYGEF